MKTFNHYKNNIEQDCEEARLAIFEFLDFIDFENFDTLVESINEQQSWIIKESITQDNFNLKIIYYESVYFLNYHLGSQTAVITIDDDNDDDNLKVQISLNVKNRLLSYLSSKKGKITFDGKPKVYSLELKEDIRKFLLNEYKSFDHVLVYEPNIDIDETVRAHSFLFDYKQNLALDLKGTYKFGDLRIKKLNLFNISNINNNLIDSKKECFEGYDSSKNIEDLQFFFESIFIDFIEDPTLNKMIDDEGLKILGQEDFRNLIELNLSF